MKRSQRLLLMVCTAALLSVSAGDLFAQQKGNFDPAQIMQRILERYREALEVKDDGEWKLIEGRINKVMEARRDAGGGFGGGFGGGGFGGGRPGGDKGGDKGGERGRNPLAGQPMPEQEALQKSIEAKASNDEIKSKLAKFREARKVRETTLDRAQEDLRQLLTLRQEAISVMMGILK